MPENGTPSAVSEMGTPRTTVSGAAPTSSEWIREFGERWLEAWNSHEADRLLALMTDDIEYRDDSWPKTMRGHADVREFLDAIWRATPDMTFELLAGPYVIPGEPRAAFHWRGWERTPVDSTRRGSQRPAAAGNSTASISTSTATSASASCGSRST